MKVVQHEKSATRKNCNMKRKQHEKTHQKNTSTHEDIKRVQHESPHK